MFIARKVTHAKWEPKPGMHKGEIPADAVTSDLRTHDNALSFWQCGSGTDRELKDVVLAIAAGRHNIDKVELVWVDDNDLCAEGQSMINTEGQTPVSDLVNLHIDICGLDYIRLGQVAHHVASALDGGQYCRLTKKRVRELLKTAVKNGRVNSNDLQEKVRAQVQ